MIGCAVSDVMAVIPCFSGCSAEAEKADNGEDDDDGTDDVNDLIHGISFAAVAACAVLRAQAAAL